MNVAGLWRHVTTMTSQATPTRPPVTSQPPVAKLAHQKVPFYYDDSHIPVDSYFTGDEDIPVWNAPDYVPLLDAAASVARADDDDDRLTALGLLLAQLSSYITTSDNSSRRDTSSAQRLVTSSVLLRQKDASSHYSSTTTQQRPQAHLPLNTTLSPTVTRLVTTTTTTPQPSTMSRDLSHVITTTTTDVDRQVGEKSSSEVADLSPSHIEKVAAAAIAATHRSKHHQQQQHVVVPHHGRPRSLPAASSGQRLGGFGNWGHGDGMDYSDFFDYIVDYQTPRPAPPRRFRVKTPLRQRNRGKSHRRLPETTVTRPLIGRKRRPGVLDHVGGQLVPAGSVGRHGGKLPRWFLRTGPHRRQKHGNSALHLATTTNQNPGNGSTGEGVLKEGKEVITADSSVEPLDRPVSIVHGYDRLRKIVYWRPKHRSPTSTVV